MRTFSAILSPLAELTRFKATGELAIEFTISTRYVPSIAPPKGEFFPHFLVYSNAHGVAPIPWMKSSGLVASGEKSRGTRLTCAVFICHILQALNGRQKFDAAVQYRGPQALCDLCDDATIPDYSTTTELLPLPLNYRESGQLTSMIVQHFRNYRYHTSVVR